MQDETVAIRAKRIRDVQHLGVGEGLLHAVADCAVVVLRLDDRKRDVWLVVEDVICPLRRCPHRLTPRTMTLPAVSSTSSRICICTSQPARTMEGAMNLVQISR
jgi:hypothetical protein